MALRSVTLRDFRNHSKLDLNLKPGITVITGSNGIGKTSILEAVSLLGSGKSFRLSKNRDYVKFNMQRTQLNASVDHLGLNSKICIEIHATGKRIELNGKGIKKLRNLYEILPFVVFSPADHKIIDGDASDRRHFLNIALSSYDPEYADLLAEYNRVLVQRNQLLRELRTLPQGLVRLTNEIEVWNSSLAKSGSKILIKRQAYVQELQKVASREYVHIVKKAANFAVNYHALGQPESVVLHQNEHEREEHLLRSWEDSMRLDFASGTTHIGPHKDDLSLTLEANEAKFYGSQGEKRTGVLALRLAEVELLRRQKNLAPILLVDDVSSELDSVRRSALVELLRQEDLQVLLTATELPSALIDAMERPYEHLDLEKLGVSKV